MRILSCLLALLGFTSACGQRNYENANVEGFAEVIAKADVVLLDVRTAEEYAEGHINRAINVDVKDADFLKKALGVLPKDKTVAVYCRSGRRSANAATQLSAQGYKVINLEGGILAWQDAGKPVAKGMK